jgi:hypothetical protein
MKKEIIKILKKNIIFFNIFIFVVAALFFYLNKDKFDTYKTYMEFNFQEKIMFSSDNESSLTNFNKIKYFLNDIDFNKKFYGIDKMNNEKNLTEKISINIDHHEEAIKFSFITKEKKFFTGLLTKKIKENDIALKNIETINIFINDSLNKFHKRLFEDLNKEIIFKKNKLDQLLQLRSKEESDYNLINMQISKVNNNINEIYKFLELNDELIIISEYNSKYRRLHLNSDEYVVSFFVLLILFNLLIKYSNKILR